MTSTVASTDPGDINTAPGATGNVQTFRVTNTGNGTEAFRLTANANNGGGRFRPDTATDRYRYQWQWRLRSRRRRSICQQERMIRSLPPDAKPSRFRHNLDARWRYQWQPRQCQPDLPLRSQAPVHREPALQVPDKVAATPLSGRPVPMAMPVASCLFRQHPFRCSNPR